MEPIEHYTALFLSARSTSIKEEPGSSACCTLCTLLDPSRMKTMAVQAAANRHMKYLNNSHLK